MVSVWDKKVQLRRAIQIFALGITNVPYFSYQQSGRSLATSKLTFSTPANEHVDRWLRLLTCASEGASLLG